MNMAQSTNQVVVVKAIAIATRDTPQSPKAPFGDKLSKFVRQLLGGAPTSMPFSHPLMQSQEPEFAHDGEAKRGPLRRSKRLRKRKRQLSIADLPRSKRRKPSSQSHNGSRGHSCIGDATQTLRDARNAALQHLQNVEKKVLLTKCVRFDQNGKPVIINRHVSAYVPYLIPVYKDTCTPSVIDSDAPLVKFAPKQDTQGRPLHGFHVFRNIHPLHAVLQQRAAEWARGTVCPETCLTTQKRSPMFS